MGGLTKVLGSYRERTHPIKNLTWRFVPRRSDLKLIFVVGAPRSGTTLVHRILSCHSRFISIQKETGFFSMSNYFNSDHFDLGSSVWPDIVETAGGPGDYFDNAISVIRSRMQMDDGIVFVEKTPQHVLHLKQLLRIFTNAKVVHIVRDGRDCFRSSKSHPNIPQRKNAACFATYWKRCLKSRETCGQDPRIFDFRYEDLTTQPENNLSSLMNFLGERIEPVQLDPTSLASDKRASRHVFERLKEPISAKTVGRWKRDLSETEISVFSKIAAKQLRQWGYEQDLRT